MTDGGGEQFAFGVCRSGRQNFFLAVDDVGEFVGNRSIPISFVFNLANPPHLVECFKAFRRIAVSKQ